MIYQYNYPMVALTADMILVCHANDRTLNGALKQTKYILLITRGKEPFKGMMAFPGGHVDIEETSEAAAIRELEEETGIILSEKERECVINGFSYSDPGRDPRGRYITEVFTCTLHKSKLPELKAGDDASEAKWVKLSEALRTKLAFDHSDILVDIYSRLDYI